VCIDLSKAFYKVNNEAFYIKLIKSILQLKLLYLIENMYVILCYLYLYVNFGGTLAEHVTEFGV